SELTKAVDKFRPLVKEKIKLDNPEGNVDILIGLPSAGILPKELERVGNLCLSKSKFGTGFVVHGATGEVKQEAGFCGSSRAKTVLTGHVMKIRQSLLEPVDFLTAEALGTEAPRKCAACKGCKECAFRTEALSWQESKELEVIEDGLKFDKERKKWVASY
ncbi:hypothetical protein DC007_14395, partial [Enterococcus faecalis]